MQEHWVGKHSLTLYSFPELNPHRLLVIVAMHLDKDTRTHACTRAHTQTWSNLNNELLAVMGKHCEQKLHPAAHFQSLFVYVRKKKQSERESKHNIYVWNYRFASACVQIHCGDCLLLKCQEASNIQQHLRAQLLEPTRLQKMQKSITFN